MKAPAPLFPFKHRHLDQPALPIGGIGAGCVCLNGFGGLQDFSIRHHPETTACPPPGAHRPDAAFALLRVVGKKTATRLIEGPLPDGKIYNQGIWTSAMDTNRGGHEGLPRFRRCRFSSGYPFGKVDFSDPAVPVEVSLVGWNPFVPLDDIASGIPCAIMEYSLKNTSSSPVAFEFSYHLSHLAVGASGKDQGARSSPLPGRGILFNNTEPSGADSFGSASLSVVGHKPVVKASWLRGSWFDGISALWREVSTGKFTPNDGSESAGRPGRSGGSVLVRGRLARDESIVIPVVIAWHFPNSSLQAYGWSNSKPPGCVPKENSPAWRPFYVTQWRDAQDVAEHVRVHYASLRKRTIEFQRALLSSSLPAEVLDAVSANLAILKSPTILRQENGNLWGWEGCCVDSGSCSGTCTHVWNYAQALPHLFPRLERGLREQELKRSMDERGHVNFRATLPDGPAHHKYHAAADGQLGGILKLCRDWKISGDDGWLREIYPLARRSLEYCINTWDPERRGGLFEPHHNTYDIEFWGADGMCGSVYVGALSAITEMAGALGHDKDARDYGALAQRATTFMEEELFHDGIFTQRVQFEGLRDKSIVERLRKNEDDPETLRLLRDEGPKYQYGKGCLSDGVIGAWMSSLYGVDTALDRTKVRSHLRSVHRHNFKRSLRGHANTQRAGYATEEEGGLLLCTWPRGGKPTLPFIYSDEVWTGIEYQVASHLALEWMPEKSLDLVRVVRRRYDGRVRNPWNEYECGSYYARAMASYALLQAWSGFRYSAVTKTLWFGPRKRSRSFNVFFSTATGFGTVSLAVGIVTLSVIEGRLTVDQLVFENEAHSVVYDVGKVARPGRPIRVRLDPRGQRTIAATAPAVRHS